jgi:hypothetical protein
MHMEAGIAAATEQAKHRSRWPKGVSGNPSGRRSSKRLGDLLAELGADFGGIDALSAIERQQLMLACRLLLRSERTRDLGAAVRATSEARRLLNAISRRPAPQASFRDRLAAAARSAAGEGDGTPAQTLTSDAPEGGAGHSSETLE